ncbi:hypothetical protein C5167_048334 [Papaver somniferum]|uniref:Peptidase M16 C-terminal domain-containing protein n=1 Tax=Papaver somniferum TaxID=3469 RepID=A0A4Y7KHM7_PAPSO|nr:hypothetical protein C5167_048334 [Papaver somniferum]
MVLNERIQQLHEKQLLRCFMPTCRDMLAPSDDARVAAYCNGEIQSLLGFASVEFIEYGVTYLCPFNQLELVYQLFTISAVPGDEEVQLVMEMAKESIHAQERDPYTKFANRFRELNYGNSYFFRPIRVANLQKVDPIKACEYFSSCFKDPSSFTVVIVGNLDPASAHPLILQYLV